MASQDLEIYITADESPTLITRNGANYEEKMHHSGGAWSETLYIYLPAMKLALNEGQLGLLSLGLGMGYNEILATALHLKQGPLSPVRLVSFEAEERLRAHFRDFIFNQGDSPLNPHYQWILKHAANHFDLTESDLKKHLQDLVENGRLDLRSPYPQALRPEDRFNCILYDAFSNKMNPELWSEEALIGHLSKHAESRCVFSTYAATGTIKRAMRALEFKKIERPGFAGKRDSSFYVRGITPHLPDAEK